MDITRNIFSLERVNRYQITNQFPDISTSRKNFGYFGGGLTPSITIRISRIDYTNDTVTSSVRTTLDVGRSYLASTGNDNYGYFGGGNSPGVVSTINRLDYSNDLLLVSARSRLVFGRSYLAATSNINYGWFAGGADAPGTPVYSTVDRIDYTSDTVTASPRGPLSRAKYALSGTGNFNYGWFAVGTVFSTDRIDYSNDTVFASSRAPLSSSRSYDGATGNSNFGYFGGGVLDRIDFTNDTATATFRGILREQRSQLTATGNSSFGYFAGGLNPSVTSTIERVDYSNDIQSALRRGSLNEATYALSSVTTLPNTIFPRNVQSLLVPTKSTSFGYFGGGITPAGVSTIDRIDYSNDLAVASPRNFLPVAMSYMASVGNSFYGYFAGGNVTSQINRLDYFNDTTGLLLRN